VLEISAGDERAMGRTAAWRCAPKGQAASPSRFGGFGLRGESSMRALSIMLLFIFLTATDARAQNGQLAPIPMPFPFPLSSSVFQWDYQCLPQKACGFTGLGMDRLSLKSATIVLANIKIGDLQVPTYFVWGTLLDGSSVVAMDQNQFSSKFNAINMRLVAAGSPGL
jgi:hypothetical protein